MKVTTISSLLGALAIALPAVADQAEPLTKTTKAEVPAKESSPLLTQISKQIEAKPSTAAEVVKQAIITSKADAELVLQIVKAAILAAPEQAEAVRKVALALAPDAQKEIEIVILSVLKGDQVAAASDKAKAARDLAKNASNEPEGREPAKNTVWLTNRGALQEGNTELNTLRSKIQNTATSPNKNHNTGANVRGGTTVIIRPDNTTSVVP